MQIEELKTIIANTPDGIHKKDLTETRRKFPRLYRREYVHNDYTERKG